MVEFTYSLAQYTVSCPTIKDGILLQSLPIRTLSQLNTIYDIHIGHAIRVLCLP